MAKAPVTIEERKVPVTPIAEKPPLTTPTPPVSIAEKPVVQPLPPVEIINKSTIKLDREIYSRKGFNKTVGIEFEEFTKKEDTFSPEQFFQLYNSLFFDIPKFGQNSHIALVRRSKEYVGNFNVNDPKDSTINSLNDKILELEQQLLLANQADPEHPFFRNGTMITTDASTYTKFYYMDKGFKRPIANQQLLEDLVIILYKTNTPVGDNLLPVVSETIASSINNGPTVTEGNFEQPTFIENGELFVGSDTNTTTKDDQILNLKSQVNQLNQTIESLREELEELETVGRNNLNQNNEGNDSEGRLEDRDFGGQGGPNFNDPFR